MQSNTLSIQCGHSTAIFFFLFLYHNLWSIISLFMGFSSSSSWVPGSLIARMMKDNCLWLITEKKLSLKIHFLAKVSRFLTNRHCCKRFIIECPYSMLLVWVSLFNWIWWAQGPHHALSALAGPLWFSTLSNANHFTICTRYLFFSFLMLSIMVRLPCNFQDYEPSRGEGSLNWERGYSMRKGVK